MRIVLLESLGVRPELVASHAGKLRAMGHEFVEYQKDTDEKVQLERARGADVLMLANMPLHRSVVTETKGLKFVDVAFTGVDHIPVAEAKELGIAVSNASGYADESVAELCLGFMIGLLRKIREQERSLRDGGTKLSGNLFEGQDHGHRGLRPHDGPSVQGLRLSSSGQRLHGGDGSRVRQAGGSGNAFGRIRHREPALSPDRRRASSTKRLSKP